MLRREWVDGVEVVSHIETVRHQEAFDIWYECNRSYNKTAEIVDLGHTQIRQWGRWFNWEERADERDRESERAANRAAIRRRAKMIERHRQAGALMVHRGTQFFANKANPNETPIERTADAINAVAKGIEIERTAEALPTWIFELLEADDETLATIVRQAAASQELGDSSGSGPLALAPGDVGSGDGEYSSADAVERHANDEEGFDYDDEGERIYRNGAEDVV